MLPFVEALSQGPPLAVHEALSGVFGSISLAAWIFLLVSILYSIVMNTHFHIQLPCKVLSRFSAMQKISMHPQSSSTHLKVHISCTT
jgi:hypothetical protein